MHHVYSLPCYELLVPLASSQRLSLLLSLAPCLVLLAWRQPGPVFPVVTTSAFAIRSTPLRRPLSHAHDAACLCRMKVSSPDTVRLVQKELTPRTKDGKERVCLGSSQVKIARTPNRAGAGLAVIGIQMHDARHYW
jgi:hypothetical protein